MRDILRLQVLNRVLLIGAAVASAAFLAWLPKLVTGGAGVQEPYPRIADHAEV